MKKAIWILLLAILLVVPIAGLSACTVTNSGDVDILLLKINETFAKWDVDQDGTESDTNLTVHLPYASLINITELILPPNAKVEGCYNPGESGSIIDRAFTGFIRIFPRRNVFEIVIQNGKNEKRYQVKIKMDSMDTSIRYYNRIDGTVPIPEDAEEFTYQKEVYRVIRTETDFYKVFDGEDANYILADNISITNPPPVAFEDRNFGLGETQCIFEGNKYGIRFDLTENEEDNFSFFHTIGKNGIVQNLSLVGDYAVKKSKICLNNYGTIDSVEVGFSEAIIPLQSVNFTFIANYNYGTIQYGYVHYLSGNIGIMLKKDEAFTGKRNFASFANYNRGIIQNCINGVSVSISKESGDGAGIANYMEGGYTEGATIRRCYNRDENEIVNTIIGLSQAEEASIRKNNKKYSILKSNF